jgi:hypothetical protein
MPTIRQLIQTSPAKANELFAKLAETSGNAVKTREPAWCTDRLAGAEELSGVGERPLSCPWMPIVPFKLNQDRRHHIPCGARSRTGRPTTPAYVSAAA